jgi:ubiquinone/menaquinone biosynthesis C-methylase UbiE
MAEMKRIDYDDHQHIVYVAGRRMSDDALRVWMHAFARHLPMTRPLRWLDVGSGTGRLTPSLAETFGGPAYGVEPSSNMRAQAVAGAAHPSVTYMAGSAEQMPLPDASCDAAVLFWVWHHVVDRPAAAAELHRVVRPGSKLFVRTNLSDRMPDLWWFRLVPEWLEVDRRMYRSRVEVTVDFTTAGWRFVSLDEIEWPRSENLTADFERLKLRPTSLFEHLSDDLIEEGFARIEHALPALDDGQPVFETSDLLVFENGRR